MIKRENDELREKNISLESETLKERERLENNLKDYRLQSSQASEQRRKREEFISELDKKLTIETQSRMEQHRKCMDLEDEVQAASDALNKASEEIVRLKRQLKRIEATNPVSLVANNHASTVITNLSPQQ